jgi:protein TonB
LATALAAALTGPASRDADGTRGHVYPATFRDTPAPPVYPSQSVSRREEGIVWVDLEMEADGAVLQTMVSRSSGFPQLDRAALEAVRRWRFLPTRLNGTAVRSWIRVPVKFVLK